MKDEWIPLNFDVKDWKGFSYILDGEAVEVLQTFLDDHLIKT
jgi:dynein heavy chain